MLQEAIEAADGRKVPLYAVVGKADAFEMTDIG
jgi:hypothetical protein